MILSNCPSLLQICLPQRYAAIGIAFAGVLDNCWERKKKIHVALVIGRIQPYVISLYHPISHLMNQWLQNALCFFNRVAFCRFRMTVPFSETLQLLNCFLNHGRVPWQGSILLYFESPKKTTTEPLKCSFSEGRHASLTCFSLKGDIVRESLTL